jgi:hypothetical protein
MRPEPAFRLAGNQEILPEAEALDCDDAAEVAGEPFAGKRQRAHILKTDNLIEALRGRHVH